MVTSARMRVGAGRATLWAKSERKLQLVGTQNCNVENGWEKKEESAYKECDPEYQPEIPFPEAHRPPCPKCPFGSDQEMGERDGKRACEYG